MGVIHKNINGKIYVEQTTYYVYRSEEDLQDDKPCLITSSKKVFDRHKTV